MHYCAHRKHCAHTRNIQQAFLYHCLQHYKPGSDPGGGGGAKGAEAPLLQVNEMRNILFGQNTNSRGGSSLVRQGSHEPPFLSATIHPAGESRQC